MRSSWAQKMNIFSRTFNYAFHRLVANFQRKQIFRQFSWHNFQFMSQIQLINKIQSLAETSVISKIDTWAHPITYSSWAQKMNIFSRTFNYAFQTHSYNFLRKKNTSWSIQLTQFRSACLLVPQLINIISQLLYNITRRSSCGSLFRNKRLMLSLML